MRQANNNVSGGSFGGIIGSDNCSIYTLSRPMTNRTSLPMATSPPSPMSLAGNGSVATSAAMAAVNIRQRLDLAANQRRAVLTNQAFYVSTNYRGQYL